jgi:hypothetical protein
VTRTHFCLSTKALEKLEISKTNLHGEITANLSL